MKIYVRRRHIELGRRMDPSRCPIACAFREASGLRPFVSYWQIVANGGSFTVSAATRKFMQRFDLGKPVKPFAFTIRA